MGEKIGLLAGKGQFPLMCAAAARQRGFTVVAVAHHAETDPALAQVADEIHWVYVGQLGKIIRIFQKAGVRQAFMAGGINRGRLFKQFRPDFKALKLIAQVGVGRDDQVLRAVAAEMERDGIVIVPATLFLDHLMAPQGRLTRRRPNNMEMRDVNYGFRVAKEVGRLDIGQCVVLRHGVVTALEAIDGTDETIRRGGLLAGPGAVVVKVCKPQQDLRFDLPAVGRGTIEVMREVEAGVLAIEAGKTLVFDRQDLAAQADQAGIAVWGVADQPEA
ncbi:MAG: LpxI family protein [Deltaproteobacteria bacterium]|nr:LpxI family protein [Deltaproteobacteria bacterium]